MKPWLKWIGIRACCAVLLLPLAAVTAHADVFTSTLTVPNSAVSGYTGPYGTVTVDLTSSTTATITFTSDTVNGNIYLFGDGSSVDVNANATSSTVTNITGSNAGTGFTPGPYTAAGSGTVDGFGTLNQTINSFDGFTHTSDTISFTLTDTSGTWSSASNVLTANAGGYDAAAHIYITSAPANASNSALATGYVAEGSAPSSVPEPASMVLFGTFLLLASFVLRRHLGISA